MELENQSSKTGQEELCLSMRKAAKLLEFAGGQRKFIHWLKANGYLMKDGEPYQEYIDRGFFTYSLSYVKPINRYKCVTRTTIKGLHYFNQKQKHQTQPV